MHPSQDPPALAAEFEWLTQLARRKIADRELADDLVQEALLAALRSPTVPRRPLRPWLWKILKHSRSDWFRRERERPWIEAAHSLDRPEVHEEDPSNSSENAELRLWLRREIGLLPEREREVLRLRFYAGLNSREIGARLGQKPTTVRGCLRRALARLRARWETESESPDRRGLAGLCAFVLQPTPPRFPSRLLWLVPVSVAVLGVLWKQGPGDPGRRTRTAEPRQTSLAGLDSREPSSIEPSPHGSGFRTGLGPAVQTNERPAQVTSKAPSGFRFEIVDPRGFQLAGAIRLESEFLRGVLPLNAAGEIWLNEDMRAADGVFCLQAEAEGYVSRRFSAVGAPGELTPLGRIVLQPGAGLAATIVDAQGAPMGDVRTLVADAGRLPDSSPSSSRPTRHSLLDPASFCLDRLGWARAGTRSNELGHVRLSGLPPIPVRLWVSVPGETPLVSAPLVLEEGEFLQAGPVPVRPWRRQTSIPPSPAEEAMQASSRPSGPFARIEGHVLTDIEAQASGKVIVIAPERGAPWTTRSDAHGRFAFEGIPQGRVSLGTLSMDAPAGSALLSQLLLREVDAKLHVRDLEGAPLTYVSLDLRDACSSRLRVSAPATNRSIAPWVAWLQPPESPGPGWQPGTRIPPGGAVELGTFREGPVKLVLESPLESGLVRLEKTLHLRAGELLHWSLPAEWTWRSFAAGPQDERIFLRAELSEGAELSALAIPFGDMVRLPLPEALTEQDCAYGASGSTH